MEPRDFYGREMAECAKQLFGLGRRDRLGMGAKIAWLLGGALAYLFFRQLSPLPLALWTAVFVLLFVLHHRTLREIRRQRARRDLFAGELAALDLRFPFPDHGGDFANAAHRYSADLDLFGPRSLFHWLNRCSTPSGRRTLAGWLLEAANASTVAARQQAAAHLAGQPDFCHRVRLAGLRLSQPEDRSERWRALAASAPVLPPGRVVLLGLTGLPLLTLAAIGLAVDGAPPGWAVLAILLQLGINRFTARRTSRLFRLVEGGAAALEVYREIVAAAETEAGPGEVLETLHRQLHPGGEAASSRIAGLAGLCSWIEVRHNGMVHGLLNNTLLWDLNCVWRVERWLDRHGGELEGWLQAVGRIEALCSLGTLRFNHPGWTFPAVRPAGPRLAARSLGHPLIPEAERVANDVTIPAGGHLTIVTGPNMAGKSTFLRTVGVNAVLALAGAPVCAAGFELVPCHLVTSMQVADSLDRHLSLFYAELRRLKLILDGVEEGRPVFFIADEMLKGTNLDDRRIGAQALLAQLLRAGAAGMVATHDLALAGLEAEFPLQVVNCHFDGRVEGDRLIFDYELRPGISRSHNAVALMRRIGIRIPDLPSGNP